jgi:hypothetical protein
VANFVGREGSVSSGGRVQGSEFRVQRSWFGRLLSELETLNSELETRIEQSEITE